MQGTAQRGTLARAGPALLNPLHRDHSERSMGRSWLAFIVLWAIGQAHADAPMQLDTEAARAQIQQVVDTFCAAVIAKDKAKLGELFMPIGHSWTMVMGDELYQQMKAKHPDSLKVRPNSYEEFVSDFASSPKRPEERF
jgi:hypothetical protein